MSNHSRSCEIKIAIRDVLPKFFSHFAKDFSFYDVKDMVKHLFSEEELRIILSETDEEKQIMQLFWILYDSEHHTEEFLKIIKLWYWWLSDKVFEEREIIPSRDTEKYKYAARALRSDFQKHLDFNVHRMEYYWSIRSALKEIIPYNYLVLSGELGAGKKWLVVDVCSEYDIMKAMGFNIFWIDVRNCTSREEDFRALQQFRLLIGEGDSTTTWRPSTEFDDIDNKILHLQQYIRDRLQQDDFKDCLLVLSDVQNSKTWKTFNLGCKILIITRNRRIANSLSETTSKHISIDTGLTTSECFQLFEKVLRMNREKFPKDATDIFIQSSGQPYLLTIIANNLKPNEQRNWTEWRRNLQNLQITDNKFTMIVEISLKVLQTAEMELYKTLTIFPHSIKIPLKLLAALWDKKERDAEYVLAKFDKYSIINRKYLPDESVACVLPYIYSSYLKTDQGIDRTGLHRKVVSYYGITEALKNRREVDMFSLSNDYYFYHCIGYHLRESGSLNLFPKLYLDFGFLGEKLRSDGFPNTIGDLKYFRNEITIYVMSNHSRSCEIKIAIRDVLPKFFSHFAKDFSFYDVKDMVKHLFSEEELRIILSETDEEKQIMQLFWILYDSEHHTEEFLKIIKLWYWWLSDKVFEEREIIPSRDTEKYKYAARALRSDFQKHLDFNVHRMEYYWSIRSALKEIIPYNYLVLSGELGAGKKWLVVDVCSEYDIMKAMGFNIFWIDVRNCTSREEDFRALQQFRLLIGEGDSTTTWRPSTEFDDIDNKILHLQQYIRDRLQQDDFKDCLLVLSDVQNSKTWKTFNLGCKILIITRNRRIANSLSETTSKHISIDTGLTTSECFQLFEKVLRMNREKFPKDATDIFIQSSGQPYLLTIIANNLKPNEQRNWTEWRRNLQNLQITDNKFTMIVEISLKVLQTAEMELYKTLTIFPHSIKIPLKLLAALWDKKERDAEYVLAKFDKYSIINRKYLPDESVACVLPYIYSSYLKTDQGIDRTGLHRKVVSYYGITEALKNRREVDMFSLSNDYYFYHCIGYHLRESGSLNLFPKLYLDFGFLGEKLRSDGFPNTIGDLKYFRNEITNDDPDKNRLVSELLVFLPNIEEMLFRSEDTCLLQYALMADGLVQKEADRQAKEFNDKIWFIEKGHFHQRRQMVCLPNKPNLIKLTEPDTCVITLDNNDILLADISLDYNNGPVYLTDNQYPISKMELLQDNYIITQDIKGFVKVWSITDDRRRRASRKRSSRTKVNPLNLTQSPEMLKRKYKQLIQGSDRGSVQTFHIESLTNGAIDLHLAFANGDICIYSWNAQGKQFEIKSLPILPTKVPNIVYLSKILDKYYLLLSNSGKIYIYNLRSGSQTAFSFKWPQPQNMVYIGEYERKSEVHIVFVCRDKVLLLRFPRQRFEFLMGDLEKVYNINDNNTDNEFICARLSPDGCYLVMGTKHGLIVFNTEQKSEVLRGNVSECIACVDIYPLDDNVFKYIIVCGSKHSKVLNLFALRQLENNTIAWSHRLSNMVGAKNNEDSNDPQFEPDVWLQGNKLFDLNYSDSILLVAADSKNRIHQLCTTDTKNWSISLPPETSRRITAITAYNHISFCAYENGAIFNITKEVFEPSFTKKSITFLQMINENTLVASSNESNQSIVRRIGDGENILQKIFNIGVLKCYTLFESYLVLVDPEGGFSVVDLNNKFELLWNARDEPNLFGSSSGLLGGCDLKNNYLILTTVCLKISIYKFSIHNGKLDVERCIENANSYNCEKTDEVTCITSSDDASLFAVGLKSGKVEIYQVEQSSVKFIFRLLSHKSKIYDLKFSPNTDILVSCSEQLCFWDVTYIVNNPFDSRKKQKRRSSRFTSSNSPEEEVTNSTAELNHSEDGEMYMLRNPWSNKCGSMEKPELLSCIKFVGNKAEIFYANEDFTQFNTIDNEGVYYHLCVHDISRRINTSTAAINNNGHFAPPVKQQRKC